MNEIKNKLLEFRQWLKTESAALLDGSKTELRISAHAVNESIGNGVSVSDSYIRNALNQSKEFRKAGASVGVKHKCKGDLYGEVFIVTLKNDGVQRSYVRQAAGAKERLSQEMIARLIGAVLGATPDLSDLAGQEHLQAIVGAERMRQAIANELTKVGEGE